MYKVKIISVLRIIVAVFLFTGIFISVRNYYEYEPENIGPHSIPLFNHRLTSFLYTKIAWVMMLYLVVSGFDKIRINKYLILFVGGIFIIAPIYYSILDNRFSSSYYFNEIIQVLIFSTVIYQALKKLFKVHEYNVLSHKTLLFICFSIFASLLYVIIGYSM